MGLLSSGAKAAAKNAVPDAGLLSPGIRAYHGSPHNFDQFSNDAIGTGEGAQAGPISAATKKAMAESVKQAKEQGYDLKNVMYHASKQDIEEFVPG